MKNAFLEYVNSKGKLAKPVVDPTGDQIDPKSSPNSPPKGKKPYVAKGEKSGKPFGDQGDKNLKYEPNTKEGAKGCKPAKIPTVEQIELCNIVTDAIAQDPTVLENIVKSIKQRGFLGALIGELLEHKASYYCLSEVMGHKTYGPTICRNLVEAMNSEEVSSPFSNQLQGEEEEEETDLDNQDLSDGEGIDDGDAMDQEPALDAEASPEGSEPMPDELGDMNAQNPVDPLMNGNNPMMGDPNVSPAMQQFQRAFQRAYQRAMMRKQ